MGTRNFVANPLQFFFLPAGTQKLAAKAARLPAWNMQKIFQNSIFF
jgi:hypothetical protein